MIAQIYFSLLFTARLEWQTIWWQDSCPSLNTRIVHYSYPFGSWLKAVHEMWLLNILVCYSGNGLNNRFVWILDRSSWPEYRSSLLFRFPRHSVPGHETFFGEFPNTSKFLLVITLESREIKVELKQEQEPFKQALVLYIQPWWLSGIMNSKFK